jgi:hypothetical protein
VSPVRPSRLALVRVVLPVTALALAAGAAAGSARHGAGSPAPAAASAASDDVSAGETAALLADVQDSSGAPLAGRDPSMEAQTSLDDAVARSSLISKPSTSSSAKGSAHDHHAMTAQEMANMDMGTPAERKAAGAKAAKKVLGDPRTSGVRSNGCVTGYGEVTQCVPAHAPGGGVTTCAYVVTVFPKGIAVTGKDTLSLDADGDGIACDTADLEHRH